MRSSRNDAPPDVCERDALPRAERAPVVDLFTELKRLKVFEYYEAAFTKATRVSLTVVPPEEPRHCPVLGGGEASLCSLLSATPAGTGACLQMHIRAHRKVAEERISQELHCFAGLTVLAMPVLVNGTHVATLLSGRVLRDERTEENFRNALAASGRAADSRWAEMARKAYFETPVLDQEQFGAILYLLKVFAQYLGDYAARCIPTFPDQEPKAVAAAKRFVESHVQEPALLQQALKCTHVSPPYFCKLFKKTTGMTFTEYISRVRVEKAKSLLLDPSLRITEVVYNAGFGSIPRFNHVFRRYVGMAPRDYRATARARAPLGRTA